MANNPLTFDEDIPTIDDEEESSMISLDPCLPSATGRPMGDASETAQEEQNVRRRHTDQNEDKQTVEVNDTADTSMSDKPESNAEPTEDEKKFSEKDNDFILGSIDTPEDKKDDMAREGSDEDYEIINSSSLTSKLDTVDELEDTQALPSQPMCKYKDEESFCDTESESLLNQVSGSEVQSAQDLSCLKKKNKTKKLKAHKSAKDSRDSDSSVSSKKRGKSNKASIKSKFAPGTLEYIGERLCGRIFSGWVEERRWVENIGGYRDVIEVDEWELEMNQQLKVIINSFPGVYEGTKWINLTPPRESPCYCIWVLLTAPPTPGHYWYVVTGVHLQPQFGLRIVVKEIRGIQPNDRESAAARRRRQRKSSNEASDELQSLGGQLQEWKEQVQQLNFATVFSAISSTITLSNIKETIRFLTVLFVTLGIGLITFFRKSHHFILHFIRETGNFFRNITPFLQSLLSFVEKLIGGMYLLIAMVYRDLRRPSPPPPPYPSSGQPPLPLTQGHNNVPMLPPNRPRVVKYVPQEHWVYKNQNS